jgi:hypothetical protein
MKTTFRLPLIAAGLLCSVVLSNAANLIVNGGFETGDFTGWTADPVSYPMFIVTSPVVPGDDYAAQIAGYSDGPDTLSQTIATTPGQKYTLNFWQYIGDGDPTTSLVVDWDNTVVYSELDTPPFNQYFETTVNVVGDGSDTLEFLCANDPNYTYLDDVSLTPSQVPDVGATVTMLGLALTGLAAFRRSRPSR